MKKVKLFIYNYGTITKLADFNNCEHDAFICLRAMNDNQVKAHGHLSEDIFYFMQAVSKKTKNVLTWVDYTGQHLSDNSHAAKIINLMFMHNLQLS